MLKKCVICGKEFEGGRASMYCSEQCKNAPAYTDKHDGERFGKLEVLSSYRKNDSHGKRRIYSVCQCDCGNVCTVRYDLLKAGNNTSCGCESTKTRLRPSDLRQKTNSYGCTALRQVGKKGASYIWECRCHCGKLYKAEASVFYRVKSCGCLREDSRKENIQKAKEKCSLGYVDGTSVTSIKPEKKMLKNNTSGVTGVTFDNARGKWRAQIEFKGKNYSLGRYIRKEDAIEARKIAEKHLFDDFLQWFKTEYPERWEKLNKKKGCDEPAKQGIIEKNNS